LLNFHFTVTFTLHLSAKADDKGINNIHTFVTTYLERVIGTSIVDILTAQMAGLS